MTKTKTKSHVASVITITLALTAVIAGVGFFAPQFAASLFKATTSSTPVTNDPTPKGSAFYPMWLAMKYQGYQNFYKADGITQGSSGFVVMTKSTPDTYILAKSIPTGKYPSETVDNIMKWMHSQGGVQQASASNNLCNNAGKWSRTADQILQSKCATGCTDWTAAFITLARAKGLAASAVDLVSDRWITESKQASCIKSPEYGHYAADVYTEKGWILVDATNYNITVYQNNDSSNIALMRFDAYNPTKPLAAYGTGYLYHILRRGIDAWDTGIKSQTDWTNAVKNEYGLTNLPNCH